MKCQACGHDNADNALFCAACRRPLVAPTKLPTRMEPLAQPAMAAAAPALASGYGGGTASPSPRNRFEPPRADGSGRAHDDTGVMTDEEAWGAVIGDANTSYYLERFARLAHGDSGGWHWPGFFVTWYWMLYRKMWVPALVYFFQPYVTVMVLAGVAAAAPAVAGLLYIVWIVAQLAVPGLFVNRWYYNHCMKKIRDVRARGGSKEQMLGRLEGLGGTSNILVIIVAFVVIFMGIGILAAVALPAYQTYTIKAKMSEAVLVGGDVTAAVGRSFEQTGQLPTDMDGLLAQATHHSTYVKGAELDSASGTVTLHVQPTPTVAGSLQFVPSADNHHHLTWTCTTSDLKRYVPQSCRQ